MSSRESLMLLKIQKQFVFMSALCPPNQLWVFKVGNMVFLLMNSMVAGKLAIVSTE